MSSDRRPAKVRVVSASADPGVTALGSQAEGSPARRRGDRPDEDAELIAQAVKAAAGRQGGSLLWVIGALGLFLLGSVIGGVLLALSGLASAASL